MLRSFFAKEEGQGLVEYALILVLIAVVVIGALSLLGNNISNLFTKLTQTIK
jgi:pilus assembly protein Flp/PilA